LGLALGASCNKDDSSNTPDSSNLLGTQNEGGGVDLSDSDEFGDDDDDDALAGGEEVKAEPFPKLPKPSAPVEKCKTTGKGKKKVKECKMVDPHPDVSAAYGARTMLGDYRWGMTPNQVFSLLSRDIETEYAAMQKKAKDAMSQDNNRRWRQDQLAALKANHVKFIKATKHRWGVSMIQYDYEDDANEEMLWVNANPTLRKYYFFKDGELWKILYAYSTDSWPGKTYEQVVEEKFKKWFGPSPTEKVKTDPKTAAPLIRYNEWKSKDGDLVRSFDLGAIHGVFVLTVVSASAEDRIGERLPNLSKDEGFSDDVSDVLGGSDVCYDKSGNISECAESGGGDGL
jgi:hypothetical protein